MGMGKWGSLTSGSMEEGVMGDTDGELWGC